MTGHGQDGLADRVLSPLDALLVVGGNDSHDHDYARPELIRAVTAGRDLLIDVRGDFGDLDALARTATLLTYTCDLRPSPAEEEALRDFVHRGGRWLALHATNALFDVEPEVRVVDGYDTFFATIGSKFRSHPPICDFPVRPTGHPLAAHLLAGIEEFQTSDELYLLDDVHDVEVLLEVGPDGPHAGAPLAYVHRLGAGQVLYCSLGHSGSPTHPHGQHRCSWAVPGFRAVLERLVAWQLDPGGR